MGQYSAINSTSAYSASDSTIMYSATKVLITYSATEIYLPTWVHTHGYFVVPSEQIDGERVEFTLYGKYMEVLLNGIPQRYTKTDKGIILDEAPVVGDHLWGWWTF